ncbi:MAG: class II aldolase/adducin family protein [Anaerolineae bacterium]|mgnify:CR=1 FL=1|jgi:L-ribulose-5-phosphate 4-epimerase|nr:class II aldolase/adducin family protein [Anaerolineae bacterium]MBT4682951.1 class II aldolase/adducin family protein [Chloroflexota bacterium]MBT4311205.1 class II aldolase/adducin family protein [Anaerolineae bacterium]MBT4459456.1 class II aldolase/adducin family protein [Anaerolineae bacterium]MBT6061449.1 class II aldolase/adducin family protein [Anaerolineae bacterium]
MNYKKAREELLETVVKANEVDLIRLSAGNISTRTDEGMVAITPSDVSYRNMTIDDISIIDLDGNLVEGLKPSSETPMHIAIYQNLPDVGAICHTHSIFAITFAMLDEAIPMVNIELMVCGAPIPVAPWASPATYKAGEVAVDIFKKRPELKTILLRKHGLVAIGSDLNNAFNTAFNAEVGFQSYYQALQLGKPEPITDEEFAEIKAAYRS